MQRVESPLQEKSTGVKGVRTDVETFRKRVEVLSWMRFGVGGDLTKRAEVRQYMGELGLQDRTAGHRGCDAAAEV